ncbi:MAG: hypothetical protein A2007_00865 [Verrucomicrobia bacterium GWC2_42_7]|nr:MAG: hypothetical protein A2007_00865 [Verrucomicrobia bacterium GWC2_42_7]
MGKGVNGAKENSFGISLSARYFYLLENSSFPLSTLIRLGVKVLFFLEAFSQAFPLNISLCAKLKSIDFIFAQRPPFRNGVWGKRFWVTKSAFLKIILDLRP